MPVLLLFALPFLEIYFLYEAALLFGFVNLVFFLIVKSMIGKMIMRQGGQPNTQQDISKAAALGISGLLISLPALLTNVVGLLILFPPTRWLLMKIFKNIFKNLAQKGNFQVFNFSAGMPGGTQPFQQRFERERDVTPLVIDVSPIQKTDKRD